MVQGRSGSPRHLDMIVSVCLSLLLFFSYPAWGAEQVLVLEPMQTQSAVPAAKSKARHPTVAVVHKPALPHSSSNLPEVDEECGDIEDAHQRAEYASFSQDQRQDLVSFCKAHHQYSPVYFTDLSYQCRCRQTLLDQCVVLPTVACVRRLTAP